jgi:hypothetical protein
MRRTVITFALTLLAAAALSTVAHAKEGGVELSSVPTGLNPGEPWTTDLVLVHGPADLLAKAEPGIQITNLDTGQQIDYPASPGKGDGVYVVTVVFPEAGTWAYSAYDGVTGRMYEYPAVEITGPSVLKQPPAAAAKAPSKAPGTAGGDFPLWPLIGALGAFALASAAAVLVVRRRQPRPSH